MMIKASTKTLNYCNMYQLSVEDVYMAVLSVILTDVESFVFTHEVENNATDSSISNRTVKYVKDHPGIRDLRNWIRSAKLNIQQIDEDEDTPKKKKAWKYPTIDTKSKDSIIAALAEQYDTATDPKTKADIAMKIADLQKMKQDDNKTQEQLVKYFLPLRCKECNLYIDAKKEKDEQNKKK